MARRDADRGTGERASRAAVGRPGARLAKTTWNHGLRWPLFDGIVAGLTLRSRMAEPSIDETAPPDVSALLVQVLYCREEARLLGLELAEYLLDVVVSDLGLLIEERMVV